MYVLDKDSYISKVALALQTKVSLLYLKLLNNNLQNCLERHGKALLACNNTNILLSSNLLPVLIVDVYAFVIYPYLQIMTQTSSK